MQEKEKKVTQLQSQYIQQQERRDQILKKRKKGLIRRLTVFGIFVILTTGVMASTLFSQSSAIDKKVKEKENLEQQLAELEREQKLLEEEVVKLNDDEYIAKIARRDYFLSDKNEIIFKVSDEE
ncbi:septum formation initiator family protein [Bacillus lacus]|uniref:Septum formation initiator family protein n=1 Tax=Metabacillus lacus TaxID=1983721 RepID=A0A7X2LZ23_9BACI|nr:septum formation initiator family protein [Metabacillus lacus]MRX72966.1 septum formation initiator family protein [Metabacillus lacus]